MKPVIGYASATGALATKRIIEASSWRWLLSPYTASFGCATKYAADNGAWTAYQQKHPFDADKFQSFLMRYGARADWIVLPDIVAGGSASLALSLSWLERLSGYKKILLPVQNGMDECAVLPHLSARVGIFLGGDTDYKLSTGHRWGEIARDRDCYFHVARVNTARRIMWCSEIGADSFDGTSISRYNSTFEELERARLQPSIFRRTRG